MGIGAKLELYYEPAGDYPAANLLEFLSLCSLYNAIPTHTTTSRAICVIEESEALRFARRAAGARLTGVKAGYYDEGISHECVEVINRIIGSGTYKVLASSVTTLASSIRKIVPKVSARVDIQKPHFVIRILRSFLPSGSPVVLVSPTTNARSALSKRPPVTWPYFHPGVLPSHFSALMCNLTMCPDGATVIDPFCGSGSTLIAALSMGLNAIGVELSKKQVYGARRNLNQLVEKGRRYDLLRSDSNCLPLINCTADAACFDPPYGRVTSLYGQTLTQLLGNTLPQLSQILKSGAKMCFLIPHSAQIHELVRLSGLRICGVFTIPVHKSLVREMIICQKVSKN